MMHFPQECIAENISNSLLNSRIDFDVWPKNVEGTIPPSGKALSYDKLAYFALKPPWDKLVLSSDCESDISAGAGKDKFLERNHYTCHFLAKLCRQL